MVTVITLKDWLTIMCLILLLVVFIGLGIWCLISNVINKIKTKIQIIKRRSDKWGQK